MYPKNGPEQWRTIVSANLVCRPSPPEFPASRGNHQLLFLSQPDILKQKPQFDSTFLCICISSAVRLRHPRPAGGDGIFILIFPSNHPSQKSKGVRASKPANCGQANASNRQRVPDTRFLDKEKAASTSPVVHDHLTIFDRLTNNTFHP